MAAYSAVLSFRQTLKQLLDSDGFRLPTQKTQIEYLYEKVSSLKSSFDKILFVPKGKRDEMKMVQNKTREAIYIAQDKVEYSIKGHSWQLSDEISLKEIVDDIGLVAAEADEIAEKITNDPKAQNLFSQDPIQPKKFSSRERDTKIMGQEKDFALISDMLVKLEDKQRLVIPITGLPGLGKTTLARSIYESREVQGNFNIRAWVTVSQDFTFQEIYSNLLSSMESNNYEAGHYATQGDEQTLFIRLHQELYHLRYLIVVDDVWDIKAWEKLSLTLPDKENGSRILLTTRIRDVAESIQKDGYIHEIKPLGLEDSWKLLCYTVFDEVEGETDITKACPPELKETGRSIAQKCKGLPLSLTVVGGLLLQKRLAAKEAESLANMIINDPQTQNLFSRDPIEAIQLSSRRRNTKRLAAKEAESLANMIINDPQTQNLFSRDPIEPIQLSSRRRNTKVMGQEKDFATISDILIKLEDKQRLVIPITGLPGIGKTTLARNIYESKEAKNNFIIRAWVTVSQDFNFQEIYSDLLSSMESMNYEAGHYATQGDEQVLFDRLHHELYHLRYLIVVDDVWGIGCWEKLSQVLPDMENGSRIVLTTRIREVAEYIHRKDGYIHTMQPLGLKDSWKLLCYSVFDDVEGEADITKACPPELKEVGMSIAQKCKGLPLSLIVVGGLLFFQGKLQVAKYWKSVEEDVSEATASEGDESYMDILSLSYTYLPAKLKALFLYMGAFPEDSEVRVSKLIKLWVAEGFSTLLPGDPLLEVKVEQFVDDLIGRNLIAVRKKSANGGKKICGMHDSLRDLAVRESRKEKFFHSRKKYSQQLEVEDLEKQRRVSIHINLLMSLGDVYETTKSITAARTLLYLGPHHHHPLPFCLTFDLLRVLDAFTVYFIRFPDEFFELVHLTYLSLTYNHELPSKISRFQKLQTLMVRRQPKLIFVGASFLPDEIWHMPQLRHLWFTETDFPTLPPSPREIVLLVNLQTLTNVNAAFFTNEVLDNMPNLKKLVMWIEAPDKLHFNVAKLNQLEHFRFVVLNPVPGKRIEVEAEHFFPKTLKRLSLSGCGLPWEYMKYVGENLPELEVLKLKELAFHGGVWSPDKEEYFLENLKYLLIEYLNFQTWEAKVRNYPSLEKLILRHCYELEEIPSDLGFITPLELLELVDCSPDAVKSANAIMEEQDDNENLKLHVRIFYS